MRKLFLRLNVKIYNIFLIIAVFYLKNEIKSPTLATKNSFSFLYFKTIWKLFDV